MSFQQGLSGLNVSAKALDAIGNNIANSSTAGFKAANARFADVFAASLAGAGSSQVGIGANVTTVFQQFTQGNITATNNPLDLALNGGGFFRLSDDTGAATGVASFTRNGQFQVNKDGYIVNSGGLYLTGIPADPLTGIVPSSGQPEALQLDTSLIAPNETTTSAITFNLDSRSTPPSAMTSATLTASGVTWPVTLAAAGTLAVTIDGGTTYTTSSFAAGSYTAAQVVAALNTALGTAGTASVNSAGQIVIATASKGTVASNGGTSAVAVTAGATATAFLGTTTAAAGTDNFSMSNPLSYTASTSQTIYDSLGNPHSMQIYFVKTSEPNSWRSFFAIDGTLQAPTTGQPLLFGTDGAMTTAMPLTFNAFAPAGANTMNFTVDLTGSTQYGAAFGVNTLTQDGFTSGRLSGISVASDGTIQGQYSNGRSKDMGRLVLASFTNPNGLQNAGGNLWRETADSGQPIEGFAGQGSLGVVQSAAVEDSNVDLTAELVTMITQQRAYQANAQTIKTQDQVLQTLVNLR